MERKVKRRFRIYPTREQEKFLSQAFGCSRLVFNKALEWRTNSYKAGEKPSFVKSSSWLTELKKQEEFSFLNDVSCVPLQQSLRHLQTAYSRFFKKATKFPKFKSKGGRQSIEFTQRAFSIQNGKLRLSKIGDVKVKWSVELSSNPTTATVIKEPSGKYFVTLTVEEFKNPLPTSLKEVGIDLGIKDFATFSDGSKSSQPKRIKELRRSVRKAQRDLSRKQKGSKNREKARIKLARIHEKISNIRTDYLQKLSTRLVNDNQVIAVEDLQVSNMIKNRKLARTISEQGWREFRSMLEYKCEWYGRTLLIVDRWFPSSKKCSSCGRKNDKLKLSNREWTCSCGVSHDRDVNAANNILNFSQEKSQAAGHVASACGGNVRLKRKYVLAVPSKQEAKDSAKSL